MKIENENNNNDKKFSLETIKDFAKDKKYRWMFIAFPIMIVVTIIQFCIH